MPIASETIRRLQGRTLATAESLTGGMIGSHLTAVPGASQVYKGGVVSYVDEIKARVLSVPEQFLEKYGAVSAPVAEYMARGVRRLMQTDYALAVTGLAGPGGDDFGHEVGTVFIAVDHAKGAKIRQFRFTGDRDEVREKTVQAALIMLLEQL